MVTYNKKLIKNVGIVALSIFVLFLTICITTAKTSQQFGEKISQVEDENLSLRHQLSFRSRETQTIYVHDKESNTYNKRESNNINDEYDSDYVFIHKNDLKKLEENRAACEKTKQTTTTSKTTKNIFNFNDKVKSTVKTNTATTKVNTTATKTNTTTTKITTHYNTTHNDEKEIITSTEFAFANENLIQEQEIETTNN